MNENLSLVQILAPSITAFSLLAGTVGNLACDYNSSSTPVEVSAAWTVNGSTVTSDDDRVILEGVSLILSPVTTSDSGNYTCTLNITSLRPYVIFEVLNEATADLAVKSKLPDRFNSKGRLMFVVYSPISAST